MDIFTVLIYQPIYNLLVVFYHLFGGDLALAIAAVALLSRLVTIPFTMRQVKMAEVGQEFNAKVKEIKEKHKNNKEKQSAELLKVQSEYLPGQLSGCFSTILQLIILINILNVIRNLFEVGVSSFNQIAYSFVPQFAEGYTPNANFLGLVDLSKTPNQIGYDNLSAVLPYIVLAVLVGITQYLSTKILMGMRKKKPDQEAEAKAKKTKKSKVDDAPDFSEIMQRSTQQTMMIIPLLLVFTSLTFPAGLSLYWTVQSGLVIIQQYAVEKLTKYNEQRRNK